MPIKTTNKVPTIGFLAKSLNDIGNGFNPILASFLGAMLLFSYFKIYATRVANIIIFINIYIKTY
jgi:hypothetical protein